MYNCQNRLLNATPKANLRNGPGYKALVVHILFRDRAFPGNAMPLSALQARIKLLTGSCRRQSVYKALRALGRTGLLFFSTHSNTAVCINSNYPAEFLNQIFRQAREKVLSCYPLASRYEAKERTSPTGRSADPSTNRPAWAGQQNGEGRSPRNESLTTGTTAGRLKTYRRAGKGQTDERQAVEVKKQQPASDGTDTGDSQANERGESSERGERQRNPVSLGQNI